MLMLFTMEPKMEFKDLTPKQKIEEVLCCIAFVAFMLLLVMMPDFLVQ